MQLLIPVKKIKFLVLVGKDHIVCSKPLNLM